MVLALGGSTNAVIHLVAMAGRCGVELSLDDFDHLSRCTPVLADIRPSGEYLMEDFYYAGGLPALMAQIKDLLHLERIDGQRTDASARTSRRPPSTTSGSSGPARTRCRNTVASPSCAETWHRTGL